MSKHREFSILEDDGSLSDHDLSADLFGDDFDKPGSLFEVNPQKAQEAGSTADERAAGGPGSGRYPKGSGDLRRPIFMPRDAFVQSITRLEKDPTLTHHATGPTQVTFETQHEDSAVHIEEAARNVGARVTRTMAGSKYVIDVDGFWDQQSEPTHIRKTQPVWQKLLGLAAHKFSSVQVDMPKSLAAELLAWTEGIPDSDLAEDGRENRPHVTVKYGIESNDPTEPQNLLAGHGVVTLTLGKLAYFPDEESESGDVLYVEVVSPDLRRLNKVLSKNLDVTADTFDGYTPHVTLAYLKPGLGKEYAGDTTFAGRSVAFNKVAFNPAEDDTETTWIDLREGPPATKERAAGGPGSGRYPKGSGGDDVLFGSKDTSVAGDAEKFAVLKKRWDVLNHQALEVCDDPTAPEVETLLGQMKVISKEINALNVDRGGIEGIKQPGGPRDLVIIGAGPAGLAAAVAGGTEGLDTLFIDAQERAGGQAKDTSRVENLVGFPMGVSGQRLFKDMLNQAERCGAEGKLGVRVVSITRDAKTELKTVTLSNGETIETRTVMIATGLEPITTEFPGSDLTDLIYDAAALKKGAEGKSVVIAGGANSAAQAALGVSNDAKHVTIISRSRLEKGMSAYQESALKNHPKITVVENDEVGHIEQTPDGLVMVTKKGQRIPTEKTGIFYGGKLNIDWLPPDIAKSPEDKKILVDSNLETNIPGVYAVGDNRHGSLPRIMSSAADGQVAASRIFGYFARVKKSHPTPRTRAAAARPAPEALIAEWNALVDRLFAADTPATLRDAAFNPDQPRADDGTWTSGGAGSEADMRGETPHGGAGVRWKQSLDANGRPIPIKVATFEEAVALVHEGKVVEVKDVRAAHTLISKLAEMAKEAKAAGKDAKDYDLCQVSVANSNMFCTESVRTKQYPNGIPRLEMPQLGGKAEPGSEAAKLPKSNAGNVDGSDHFIAHLKESGMDMVHESIPASNLRGSQRELVGSIVAGMMTSKGYDPGQKPIFVSSDGYVVDGHHRWAAVVGRDAEDGKLGDAMMNIIRVNAPISELLHLANTWSKKFGIKQVRGVAR